MMKFERTFIWCECKTSCLCECKTSCVFMFFYGVFGRGRNSHVCHAFYHMYQKCSTVHKKQQESCGLGWISHLRMGTFNTNFSIYRLTNFVCSCQSQPAFRVLFSCHVSCTSPAGYINQAVRKKLCNVFGSRCHAI